MKKYKYLAALFAALAVLLSNAMCAAVAYNYCALQLGGQYAGCSAPADTAFLLGIPYTFKTPFLVPIVQTFSPYHAPLQALFLSPLCSF